MSEEKKLREMADAAFGYHAASTDSAYWQCRAETAELKLQEFCKLLDQPASTATLKQTHEFHNEACGCVPMPAAQTAEQSHDTPQMASLRMYYAQKDGCKKHDPFCGKICLECVTDALAESASRLQELQRQLSAQKYELIEAQRYTLSLEDKTKELQRLLEQKNHALAEADRNIKLLYARTEKAEGELDRLRQALEVARKRMIYWGIPCAK